MAERKVDIVIGEGVDHVTEEDKMHAFLVARAAETQPRLVDILDRGIVVDRLKVLLPEDVHGEWVPNDKMEIARYEALGFVIDTVYAPKRSLHSDGTGKAIVGDTVFMICHKSVRDTIDRMRAKAFEDAHAVGAGKKQAEEKEYAKSANQLVEDGIVPILDGSASKITQADIARALNDNKLV
jgi:hypothetical protein